MPAPRAWILSKPSLARHAPPKSPLKPTQVAPDLPTIGISAAANPPEIGPSAFALATRLETTTTLTTGSKTAVEAEYRRSFGLFTRRTRPRFEIGSPWASQSCQLAKKNYAIFLKALTKSP